MLHGQIILHYIDKLYEAMGNTTALAGRILFLQTALSLLLLSLSIGVVAVEEQVSMVGIGVKASLSVFLTGGALVVSVCVISFWAANEQAYALGLEIRKLYERLGWKESDMYRSIANPFRPINLLSLITAPIEQRSNTLMVSVLGTLLGKALLFPGTSTFGWFEVIGVVLLRYLGGFVFLLLLWCSL